jgi:hypothetical protein
LRISALIPSGTPVRAPAVSTSIDIESPAAHADTEPDTLGSPPGPGFGCGVQAALMAIADTKTATDMTRRLDLITFLIRRNDALRRPARRLSPPPAR